MQRNTLYWPIFAPVIFMLVGGTFAVADDHFRQRVAPILQRRCLSCHNDSQRRGDFALHTAEAALADGFIEPGSASGSHLVDLITPVDGKSAMPKDADPLSKEELAAIRKWIDDGARWPVNLTLQELVIDDFDWWSYRPVKRPAVPPVGDPWVRTPIDAFVLAKMKEQGLSPNRQADRRTLIRRLTYDLTGLPPTPSEVEAFVNDSSPQAYERLVDRLLESKHYGERWARHWLDVVKYADTCGYDKDKLRPNAWPYRDYVIRSFNDDKPYSRFVQEQIAGDVMFPGEPDGILGLGFIAAGPWDFIGHVEVPESKIDGKVARNLDRDDMVSNTINTFCSLTVQCARCHHHKFDPITQEQYYGLQSIFAAVDRSDRPYYVEPGVQKRRCQLENELSRLRAGLVSIDQEIKDACGPRLSELNQQIQHLQHRMRVKKEPEFGYHSKIANTPHAVKWVQVDLGQPVDIVKIELRPCHDPFANIGAGFGFPVRFKVEVAEKADQWSTVGNHTRQDFPNPGLSSLQMDDVGQRARYVRVTATKLMERDNDFNFALAELQVYNAVGENTALRKPVTSLDSIEVPVRWAQSHLTDGKFPQAADPRQAEQHTAAIKERAKLMAKAATPARIQRRAAIRSAISRAQQRLKELPAGNLVYAAATNFHPQTYFKPTGGKPRAIRVLHRGDVSQPGELAIPGVLPLTKNADWQLGPMPDEGQRRAALARWLTDDRHPLVWRSIVNRVWQYHFDQGIVSTPNDFGRMGAKPTHPELLDWLAAEFRDNGQSFKKLHRLIVTSSVYRQSSDCNVSNAEIDASNQYLWRMNRRRLEAEEIRDSTLAIGGALNRKTGGPGFYLFELENTTHSPHYQYHLFDPGDETTHRRSIYRFIVRSQPDPWMTTLDCADSSQSTPKRDKTLTSLQALSLLNSRFNLVMAERFAHRLQQEADSLPEQIDRAMMLVASRLPDEAEREELSAFAESHGLENLCRFLFNLSEFVYLD